MSRHFTTEEKHIAIEMYFQEGSSSAVVERLGYPSITTLMKWVRTDSRCSLPNIHYKQYTQEEKLRVVTTYLDGGVTLDAAAQQIGSEKSQAARWVKAYLRKGPMALMKQNKKGIPCPHREKIWLAETPAGSEIPDEELRRYCEQLKFENDVLRAELEFFSKKAMASAKKD